MSRRLKMGGSQGRGDPSTAGPRSRGRVRVGDALLVFAVTVGFGFSLLTWATLILG